MDATTIAVDLAKNWFEIAVANQRGRILRRRRLTRAQFHRWLTTQPPAEVLMETCSSAHFWGRMAQAAGHHVTLLPAHHVRPFVRRQKTDRTDVAGLIDARGRTGVYPVPIKSLAQQEITALHQVREQWKKTRTARINAVRGLLLEFGVTVAQGAHAFGAKVVAVIEDADQPIPGRLRRMVGELLIEIADLEQRMNQVECELADLSLQEPQVGRLDAIPGIGLLTATALVGRVPHIHAFRRARCFASWLGLTAREHSTGGVRRRLGAITKQGDVYLRCLLTHGARAVLLTANRAAARGQRVTPLQQWALNVAHRRGHNRATVALANKLARIVWAVWSRDIPFVSGPATAVVQ